MKRVVITGAGTINSIGQNVSQTINSFKAGRCGISDLKFKDVERLSIKIGVARFMISSRINILIASSCLCMIVIRN